MSAPLELSIALEDAKISSLQLPASLIVSKAVPADGLLDVDPHYQLNGELSEAFLIVVMRLATTAPGIAASEPVLAIQTPPGHQYHGLALALEERLAGEAIAW